METNPKCLGGGSAHLSIGHLAVLEWARANGCPWDVFTCAFAAEGGHLAVLQWARTNGCPCDVDFCILLAENHGWMEVAQWLRDTPA